LSYITISGSGEPTLNVGIEKLILEIKQVTTIPVAVLTNASLLNNKSLRKEILGADLLVPSLDTVVPEAFNKINRPVGGIRVEDIIDGLEALKKEYKGKIWLEVMLVSGINDDIRYIKKLKEVIDRINPDKIQINSPVRSTAEPNILPVEGKKLEKIQEILGEKCEIH